MNCVHCGVGLEEQYVCGLTIDVCPECDSIWFDRGELELFGLRTDRELLRKLDRSAEFDQKSRITLDCPKCKRDTLVIGEIGGYQAGQCSKCLGFWVIQKKRLGNSRAATTVEYVLGLFFGGVQTWRQGTV